MGIFNIPITLILSLIYNLFFLVKDFCPYESIEIIFNHKNLWLNTQNQNPLDIYYHLFDENQFYPFLKEIKKDKTTETWRNKLGAFYPYCNHDEI